MELIARGRAADVYEAGPGRVLRRYRTADCDTAREAEIMRLVAATGYPVPAVYGASGADLILERIDGPTMLDALGSQPWRLLAYATQLADLHTQLGVIPAPEGLPQPLGPGSDLLHLDLHPDNVILAPRGPVVIDWTNAAAGPAAADIANTWLLLACARPDNNVSLDATLQRLYAQAFLSRAGRTRATGYLHAAFTYRASDRNTRPEEAARMRRLVRDETGHEPD